jgi:hypothetical protein
MKIQSLYLWENKGMLSVGSKAVCFSFQTGFTEWIDLVV